MRSIKFGILLISIGAFFWMCEKDDTSMNEEEMTEVRFEFKNSLAQLNIFEGALAELNPSADYLPYDLNASLFTDYAHKLRFVHIPDGEQATHITNETLEFPDNSILVKNFFYPFDERNLSLGYQIIETRVLAKLDGKWDVGVYVWNAEQTDAKLKIIGDNKTITWINEKGLERTIDYKVPSENDCKVCHKKNNSIVPIGPKLRNINKLYDYTEGSMNQIEKWQSKGWIDASLNPQSILSLPDYNNLTMPLEDRAKAYLDINCAHCHRLAGHASNTGLYLEYEQENMLAYGFCKTPVSAGSGSGGLFYDIVPGKADSSILHFRMNSDKVGIAMPEIGKTIVHDEGVALIADWINSLSGVCN